MTSDIEMKTLDDYFSDWESETFGFGYGTGEEHILPQLKRFFAAISSDGGYDHRVLEGALGGAVAWLLINVLCRADILEYGTSPRYGWLTRKGKRLKEFVDARSVEALYALTCRDPDYAACSPKCCNCGPRGYENGRVCANPFWCD